MHTVLGVRVVVVEDETLTRSALVHALAGAGYHVRGASDVAACRAALSAEPVDLVILDIGLPGESGLSYARELRATSDVVILFVTATESKETEIDALDNGGDAYLVKPIDVDALKAHVRALLRRQDPARARRLRFGEWSLDPERRTLSGIQPIEPLTRGEFNLITLLAKAEGRIVSRELLSEAVNRVQHGEQADIRSVDALVSRIRRKLNAPRLIVTVPNFGYRLAEEVHRE